MVPQQKPVAAEHSMEQEQVDMSEAKYYVA